MSKDETTMHCPDQEAFEPPAPSGSLVERLACMYADFASTAKAGQSAKPLARAAIREVVAWLREGGDYDANAWASLLEQEAER